MLEIYSRQFSNFEHACGNIWLHFIHEAALQGIFRVKCLWKMFIVECCGLLYTKLNHFSVCLPEKKNSNQPQQSHKKGKKAFPTLYLVVSVLVVVVWLLQLSKGIHYSVFFMRNAVIKVLSRAKSWLGNVKKTHSILEELLVNPNWCL